MADRSTGSASPPPLSEAARAAMRLRPERPRVTRLSRRVLVGVGAIVTVGLGAILAYALVTRNGGGLNPELFSPAPRTPPDSLSALPKDYTGIPKLGPPLPGDLGRPILHSQGGVIEAPSSVSEVTSAEERQRQQEIDAARTSRLFAGVDATTSASPAVAPSIMPANNSVSLLPAGVTANGPASQPTPQERQLAFLNATVDRRTVAPDRVAAPASPYILQAGAVIPAAMITGIRSDLPGQITAQVTENVYDSPTGQLLLVPQGTRVIGQYDNDVGFGQSRILLVWNRLIFPNGRSIVLERQPGANAQGYAGVEDSVDYHWWDLAKAAGLSTLLNVGAELATDDNNALLSALRDGFQETVGSAGQQIVRQQLSVPPTLTVQPGFPVRVIVTRDLILEPYGG
ncbi:MAG: TrbI/VirB10 family protein [Devosia sp.]|nr:TrbI/VirB10 family protein [Devosia sp.]